MRTAAGKRDGFRYNLFQGDPLRPQCDLKMTAQPVRLLVFLVLITGLRCSEKSPFILEKLQLTAVEGSCIEIKCKLTKDIYITNAYWFWLKNGSYNDTAKDFTGTVVFSSDQSARSVSPDYVNRVEYTGSLLNTSESASKEATSSIKICNLNETDGGEYAFRYIRRRTSEKWMTNPNATLKVEKNLCPITFETPLAVKENSTISLKCSTPSSCSLDLKIEGLGQDRPTQTQNEEKRITISYEVSWKDDLKEISCQTLKNSDVYSIKTDRLTVQYAPKEMSATSSVHGGIVTEGIVKEGQSVTLTCSAKGNPKPTITWFKNGQKYDGAALNSRSVTTKQSGNYSCEATNTLGKSKSEIFSIDIKYMPIIEVQTSPADEVTEGDDITFTCNVLKSNPKPRDFVWLKNGLQIKKVQTFSIPRVRPEDKGRYTCKATNSVGTRGSQPKDIEIKYRPRETRISSPSNNTQVEVNTSLQFTCDTDAYPSPKTNSGYSWFSHNTIKATGSSQLKSSEQILNLEKVQRADEACYMCRATNEVGPGFNSTSVCIQVLYPPTPPIFTVDKKEIKEGQPITFSCTVESFPPSELTLTWTSKSTPWSSEVVYTHPANHWRKNTFQRIFNVTSADSGFYTCEAENNQDSSKSERKELVVKYRPKDVTVQPKPDAVVKEYTQLTLSCSTNSYPPVTSFTWTKRKDGKAESIGTSPDFIIKSVSPSDSGLYSCEAKNEMGTGKSQEAEIKVKYAPKLTEIQTGEEEQQPDGRSSVTLSCVTQSFPAAHQFSWYKQKEAEDKKDQKILEHQTLTVFSDNPGTYYCIAKNEIDDKKSEPIQVFVDKGYLRILIFILLAMVLIFLLCFLVYRHKKKKPIVQRNSNPQTWSGSLGRWIGSRRRGLMNEPATAEPFRSRDDLLPDQPCRSKGQQRQQPRPDSIPASKIDTVYCTVNLPAKQGPSGEMPAKQKARHTQDDALNYASLHFEKRNKNKAEMDEYAVVPKKKKPTKAEEEKLEDYENIRTAYAAKFPNPADPTNSETSTSSESSEDEVELNYAKVSFKAKPGHQRAHRDSSTSSTSSEEEETQYSQVKM
ncbi:B-cell receptor CD22 [Xyrichtys novacula]|uniref:B-cell receptor CD22 n=1 Tax=Xyrichtys novacula TaxID=13765 RepID=A0AAV1FN14_XYRNO|nr:B-cell receptor CD22 [Xyrichtys novacula]